MSYKKNMNNIHDKSYKDLYSNKEVFLDLAKGMLNVPWTKDLKEDNLVLVDKGYILSDYEENESDIVYKANIDGKEVRHNQKNNRPVFLSISRHPALVRFTNSLL